jgi:Glyoxalase/Bleomycin resistance protein/Dioxygenase superfamily
MDEFRYKGQLYDLKVSIALANSGDVQLELIQQRNDVPSLYSDFLAAGYEGMQHWSSWPVNYHEIPAEPRRTIRAVCFRRSGFSANLRCCTSERARAFSPHL